MESGNVTERVRMLSHQLSMMETSTAYDAIHGGNCRKISLPWNTKTNDSRRKPDSSRRTPYTTGISFTGS
ncbi:hypothetical protein FOXYSP1_19862 [Fusarium oxysporum f. sp. phaseoli]